MDQITKAEHRQRAEACWELMDANEKAAVRIGLTPHWTALEDLGGKRKGFPALETGDDYRLAGVALMQMAKENGGMIV